MDWENSRQLCKSETKSRVCITVENYPTPSSVYIRLCKHRKKVFYCFYKITFLKTTTREKMKNSFYLSKRIFKYLFLSLFTCSLCFNLLSQNSCFYSMILDLCQLASKSQTPGKQQCFISQVH